MAAPVALGVEPVQEAGIHVALSAERIGELWGIPITNTLLTSWIVLILLGILAWYLGSRVHMIPSRLQTLFEWLLGGIYDYVTETLESREMARRFFPLLITIFLFIFASNVLEFIPGVGSVGFYDDHGKLAPLIRPVNTDLNVPLALSLISFLVIEITGILTLGFLRYGRRFISFKSPIAFAIGVIELIGELVRVVSLSFRLFGNILAGAVVLHVAIFFIPYLGPVPLMLFELFVGFLQAAIFALLTLFFIKLAITDAEAH